MNKLNSSLYGTNFGMAKSKFIGYVLELNLFDRHIK